MPPPDDRASTALRHFATTPFDSLIFDPTRDDPSANALALFQRTSRQVPAYGAFLQEHGVDPATVRTAADFARLPLMDKAGYVQKYPLEARCRNGSLSACDMVAVSSGSTGEPTFWPRFLTDEYTIAQRFEQVFLDAFGAGDRATLAVVCFPLGTWVGGMFTAACVRHLAAKGYPITVVTPGNQKQEIFRVVSALGPRFAQTVLLGYPPFLKDVIDAGRAQGIPWSALRIKLVMAGEVFSEPWRALMAERAGLTRPEFDTASLYGTADAGVLGNETPVSIAARRFLAGDLAAARELFGETRLPTLVQYDPMQRYFESRDGTLIFTGDNGVPLVRYHISDAGGLLGFHELLAFLERRGFDAAGAIERAGGRVRALPFAFVFGRSHFAVSIYGANVFPETIALGLEEARVRERVTGRFVMEVREDAQRDLDLCIAVELAADCVADDALRDAVAECITSQLLRCNSEYANYVPAARRTPRITLWPAGHPEYFPAGVKHRYSRK